MQTSDLKELRKVLKSKDPSIDWIYGLYVSAENEPVWEKVQSLRSMEEAEFFRHINIISRALSGGIGKNLFPVPLRTQQESLLALRSVPGKEESDFSGFRDFLLENHVHTDPYYCMMARIAYDVPRKASDGRKLEDGDVVYESLLVAICPAVLSKPSLGFEDDCVKELERRWNIGNPICGFLYPSFDNRSEDRSEALECAPSPASEAILGALFDAAKEPIGQKDQKELFGNLLGRMEIGVEDAAAIQETISEKASDGEAELSMQGVRQMAEELGVPTQNFEQVYEETVGSDTVFSPTALAETYVTVKTGAGQIRVPSDKSSLIRMKTIDGISYLLIPADGEVLVNGVPVAEKSGADTDIGRYADTAAAKSGVTADTDPVENAGNAAKQAPPEAEVPWDTDLPAGTGDARFEDIPEDIDL